MYVTLTALWKFFHYSPKRAESLKMVQQLLDLPELKIAKSSDTRWLAGQEEETKRKRPLPTSGVELFRGAKYVVQYTCILV